MSVRLLSPSAADGGVLVCPLVLPAVPVFYLGIGVGRYTSRMIVVSKTFHGCEMFQVIVVYTRIHMCM